MRAIALTILATLTAACGGTPAKPAAPAAPPAVATPAPAPAPAPVTPAPSPAASLSDADFEAMMQQAVGMFAALGAAADNSAGDCGKLADLVDQAMVDHHPFIAAIGKYKGDAAMDKRSNDWISAHPDAMTPVTKFAGAASKCTSDPKFTATMKRLGDL
jgi:3-oxoacyl-ACP reductase-like protein